MVARVCFSRWARIAHLVFQGLTQMLPKPIKKTRKGARSEARGRRPNAPFLVFLVGPGVASLFLCVQDNGA